MIKKISVPISQEYNLGRTKDEECITGDQTGCYYHIVIYDLPTVDLPDNGSGYVISYQRCCRIAGIQNMPSGSSNSIGNTYSIEIPGKNVMAGAEQNTSAQFLVNDTTVVCGGSLIARSRKELHRKVGDCNAIKATLNPQYITCDGFSLSFFNQTNNGIHTYEWEFGVPAQNDDTANVAAPTYTFSDTGTYVIKL